MVVNTDKHDDADAIIKEGFSRYFDFQGGGDFRVSQDAKNCNGICRRYEGAE